MEYVLRYGRQADTQWRIPEMAPVGRNRIRRTCSGTAGPTKAPTSPFAGSATTATRHAGESTGYASLGSGFGDQDSIELISQWMDFVDQSRPWQATLYKEASEVDILPGT